MAVYACCFTGNILQNSSQGYWEVKIASKVAEGRQVTGVGYTCRLQYMENCSKEEVLALDWSIREARNCPRVSRDVRECTVFLILSTPNSSAMDFDLVRSTCCSFHWSRFLKMYSRLSCVEDQNLKSDDLWMFWSWWARSLTLIMHDCKQKNYKNSHHFELFMHNKFREKC